MSKAAARALVLFLALMVVACSGGGESDAPATASTKCLWVSASDSTGNYVDNGVVQQYLPDPVAMVNALGSVKCENRSTNGLTLDGLIASGLLAQILAEKPGILVLGAGTNDALFFGKPLDVYLENLRTAVGMVRAAGAQPYLRGFNRFEIAGVVTPERMARRNEFNAAAKLEANRLGVTFLDLDAVEYHGLEDLSPDLLHAKPSYNWRIAAYIASQLH